MSASTVTEFVTARLDEVDARPCCDGTGEYSACAEVSERYELMAKAMREIVALVTSEQPLDQGHWEGSGGNERWVSDHAPEILRDLASIWSDHADFNPDWA